MRKKTMLCITLSMMMMSLAACSSKKNDEQQGNTEPDKEQQSSEAMFTPGVYESTSKGFGGDIKVTMKFDESKITEVNIVGEGETEGVGSRAVESLPDVILEKQSAEVDTVTGATISSKAILTSVQDCIAQAKGTSTEKVEAKMAPGTYTGHGTGFRVGEAVTVAVTVDETKITNIEVDQENTSETTAMLQNVVDLMLPRIMESQSLNVDAITGATSSSNGVKQAIEDALTQALAAGGSDQAAIKNFYTEIKKDSKQVTLQTEVLVVGMGGSGTAAALSAAENGAHVLAIDKAGKWGGTSAVTSGPMAINVPSQVAAEIPEWTNPSTKEVITKKAGDDLIDAEALYQSWLEYTTIDGVQTAKPEMVRIMIDESGYTVDWLQKYGFSFDTATGFAGNSWAAYTPHTGAKKLTESFYASAYDKFSNELGGEYMLETEAYDLIVTDGKVTGVLARNTVDGTEYTINADAVILACGGFAGNTSMEEELFSNKYFPLKGGWNQFGMHQNDGKMLQAALDDGAGTFNISVAPMVHVGGSYGTLSGYPAIPIEGKTDRSTGRQAVWSVADIPLDMAISTNTLAVGKDAKRFTNENALSMFNPWIAGPNFYSIWGSDQIKDLIANGFAEEPYGVSTNYLGYGSSIPAGTPLPETEEVLEAAIKAGYVYKADTLEELASQMGLDSAALTQTVEQYNGFCANGQDDEFGKDAKYLVSVQGAPYYGIKGASYCYSTCGGLDINDQFQVLKADGTTPIDGLYAVGTDSMGVLFSEAKAYVTYGGAAQGWAFTSGRMAGKVAADTIK